MISTVKKKVVLVDKVRELKLEISELKSSNKTNLNKEEYSINQREEEHKQEEKNEKKGNLIRSYIEVAESVGKKYNSNISTGNKVMVFEAVNLEMTANQIKKTLTKISSEEFGIKIEDTENLEFRVAEVEKKLQEIKIEMESQRSKKRSFFKFFKSRFAN